MLVELAAGRVKGLIVFLSLDGVFLVAETPPMAGGVAFLELGEGVVLGVVLVGETSLVVNLRELLLDA
jgi:hypothetical protein